MTRCCNPAKPRRGRHGIGLVELALALAVGALLVAGAVLYFANASAAHKTNETMSQLTAIQQVVHGLYSGQPDYTGLTSNIVAQSKQLPSRYVVGDGSGALTPIRSPFNTPVSIQAVNAAGNGGVTHFIVAYTGIPDAACTRMATTDFGTSLARVFANSATSDGRPLTPAAANGACSGNNNLVAWVFN